MSRDKYPSIFSPQMEAIVFIILQIFFATRAVLKIGEYLKTIPPEWRRLVLDIYRAMRRQSKYTTLATDTEVNSCFSIYQNSEIIYTTKN